MSENLEVMINSNKNMKNANPKNNGFKSSWQPSFLIKVIGRLINSVTPKNELGGYKGHVNDTLKKDNLNFYSIANNVCSIIDSNITKALKGSLRFLIESQIGGLPEDWQKDVVRDLDLEYNIKLEQEKLVRSSLILGTVYSMAVILVANKVLNIPLIKHVGQFKLTLAYTTLACELPVRAGLLHRKKIVGVPLAEFACSIFDPYISPWLKKEWKNVYNPKVKPWIKEQWNYNKELVLDGLETGKKIKDKVFNFSKIDLF